MRFCHQRPPNRPTAAFPQVRRSPWAASGKFSVSSIGPDNRLVSMLTGVVSVAPAVVGRAGVEFLPGERRQSTRIGLFTGLLRLPHDQIGDRFSLAQLIAV